MVTRRRLAVSPPLSYRGYEASQMNLSQASALMSGPHRAGKNAQAAVYAGRPEVTFAEARYAMVWTEYLASQPEAEGREQLLDWLTSRSMEKLDLLRAYHRDFSRALRRRCR